VGLLARGIEACGITTVCLALVRELALQVRAPRMLYLHWPFGHALGEPENVLQQRTILHDLLSLAQSAPSPGLVVDLPYRWRREVYHPVSDWTSMSEACAEGLREAIECVEKP
jgi:hypothetical protein